MIKLKVLVLIGFILNSSFAFSHGEDKYGPHGGFVRMPGGFHVEVVPESKNTIKVFLLDIEWKNPSVKNSEVSVVLNSKPNKIAKCEAKNAFYECKFSKSVNLKREGELFVEAKRENQRGILVKYLLPLKLEGAEHKK